MLFDQLRERVRQRINDYARSRQADTVLSEEALVQAAELWQAAQPADPSHPTPDENQRLAAAHQIVGWLHFVRFTALPAGPRRFSEMAQAIVYLAPLSKHEPNAIPEPFRPVLGANADADYQVGLAEALRDHAETTADPALIDASIWLFTASMAAAPPDHSDRAATLGNLCEAYGARFERGGVLADLERAIETGRQAVAATPADHPRRAGRLSNLGVAYRRRFDRGGVLADLDQAIDVTAQAVAATTEIHPGRAMYFSNLGVAYRARFERGGVLADLERAIETGRQAVAATPADHPSRAASLSNLGAGYRARFEHGGVLADLDQAIEFGRQAVAATPADHPDPAYLGNLGIAYRLRFERGGVLADLDQAIDVTAQAVAATPVGNSDRSGRLSDLGNAYLRRFERVGVLADLDQAIEFGSQAVAATHRDHSDRAAMLSNLGGAYQTRLAAGGQRVDRDTLLTLAQQVVATATAPPAQRIQAGHVVGLLAHASSEHTAAVELFDIAVALLPSVAPREAGLEDQEYRLGEHGGLVGDAIAAHCAINDPVGAVEAAELGRGILLAAQLDSRSDLTDLDHAHPDLAAEFRRVRDQLNAPQAIGTATGQPPIDPVGEGEHRARLWSEHDQLLAKIRHQPGFARFLRSPRLEDLQPATAGGAVILVNSGRQRSDAIILTAHADPVHVFLPAAAFVDVQSQTRALLTATHGGERQRVLPDILGWLWDTIVSPVLNTMPPADDRTSAPPRVWWLPTGLLGLFPLHAAGHPGHPGALDTAISSYTSTLRTLAHARSRPPVTVRRQLTAALHHTPGLPDLPGTVAEATSLHADHPDGRLLLDEKATTSRVLAALPGATWAHFACHASADLTTPSQGGLALHDTTLALPDISQLQLDHAELAYLSACSTAHRGRRLADESLHLASAFQLAGFRHVIGSLWPLNDHIAATAAAAFYQRLPDTPTAADAAAALHHVTRELRAEYPDRPDLWAAFIHSGP